MKMAKYNFLYLFVIILLIISLLNSGCGETNDLNAMEKKAIKAVHKAYSSTKEFQLVPHLENKPFFSKSLFFRVSNYSVTPSIPYIVAIDKKTKKAGFVLIPHRRQSLEIHIDNFSKIIAKESLRIDQSNIEDYINSFLFLVSPASLVDNIEDIKYLSNSEVSDIKKEFPDIGVPRYDYKDANISIEFYSYGTFGFLKWNLTISQNGEVISYKFKEFKINSVIL